MQFASAISPTCSQKLGPKLVTSVESVKLLERCSHPRGKLTGAALQGYERFELYQPWIGGTSVELLLRIAKSIRTSISHKPPLFRGFLHKI